MTDLELRRALGLSFSSEEAAIHRYEALAEAAGNELAKAEYVLKERSSIPGMGRLCVSR